MAVKNNWPEEHLDLINNLLIIWKVISERLVTQLRLIPCDPMDCSPPGSSVHGMLQVRTLEWVAILFSRGSS